MPEQPDAESMRRTAAEASKVNDFIISLIEDPARLAKFREGPDDLLAEAEIPPQIGEVLKFGDRLAVLRAAGGPAGTDVPVNFTVNFAPKHQFTIIVVER